MYLLTIVFLTKTNIGSKLMNIMKNFGKVFSKKKQVKKDKKCHSLQKSHANKCHSCEYELPRDQLYKSQKTKCFSCEKDLKQRFGPKMAFFGQPSKCFDCEAQLK